LHHQELTTMIQAILSEKKHKGIQESVDLLYQSNEQYHWIGIYIVKDAFLHLGPWQGKQATEHTKIPIGTGVCGSAAKTGKTENISNVHVDKRYLSCFVSTRSEIVVPIKKDGIILGEIDIDSNKPDAFTKEDVIFLETIADMLAEHIRNL
jgi:putative methionine-R-sulfoxide reductase with GAF domain